MTYLKLGKLREAERDASKSLQLLPAGNPKALFRRGLARKGLGKIDLARQGAKGGYTKSQLKSFADGIILVHADFLAALAEEPTNVSVKTELEALPTDQGDSSASTSRKPDDTVRILIYTLSRRLGICTILRRPSSTYTNPQSPRCRR